MNRHIVYPGQIPLDTDLLNAIKDAYYGTGWLSQSALGTGTTVVGLAVTPTIPASLQVNVAPGAIYSFQTVDSSGYGSLSTDTNQFLKQGIAKASQTLTLTPPGTTGQSINYLVQVAFSETDTSAITLPYYNASNPSIAWSGPNNTGTAQNTVRQDLCVVQLKAGTPAATGSQTTPSPDAGFTGIYVVTVANGQTTITSGNISQLATAPYFPTLPQVPSSFQGNSWVYAVAGGTANALTATLTPLITANTAGTGVILKITTKNTGVATLDVGAGPLPIQTQQGNALQIGDLPANAIIRFICTGAAWQIQGISYSEIPVISTSNVTLYVRPDGNDANDGSANDSAHAFQTIAAAVAYGNTRYFLANSRLVIQLGIAGTYTPPGPVFANVGSLEIKGSTAAQDTYIIAGAGPAGGSTGLFGASYGQVFLTGVFVKNSAAISSNACVIAINSGTNLVLQNVTFGTDAVGTISNLVCSAGASVTINAGCKFGGSATNMLYVQQGSIVIGASITIINAPVYTNVANATALGAILLGNPAATVTGSVTGVRYVANLNGVINTFGGGANYFPGTSAGVATNGGQYA
ncbi:hypothetical protein [Rhizobium lusitanum]|uniref:hypothetical protein n=1 Tax=Rhizobium lusitanum TaxID=293958 RepID=UPI00195CFB4A|nr:hypothetical protein [Rhizobium lusitanum]MBM7045455.1 hypothetical protein [Rhizobium lusitanum]